MKAGNNSRKIKDRDISDDLWNSSQSKNFKFRLRRFSAGEVRNVKPSNRFTVLHIVQQSTGFLKHVENKVKPLAGKTKSQKKKIHYLEVFTGGKSDPCSKKTWALNAKLQVLLSPMLPLLMWLRTFGSLVITLPSEIILKWEGKETAWIEFTITRLWRTLIPEKSNKMNVRFVNLFWRHDKPRINRKVRSVNLRLDQAPMGGWQVPQSCYWNHIISKGRLNEPWPASKFTRQNEAYTSYC